MQPDQTNPPAAPENQKFPAADYGNASNPSPYDDALQLPENQLLDKHAEKYLREVASIEDVPDAEDQQEMDEIIKKEKETGETK